ncbi:MAG: alginate export family protein, partial [Niabella sp.]
PCFATTVYAQQEVENSFSFSGQLRPRLELRAGAFKPLQDGEQPAILVSDRLRLQLNYAYKDVLEIKIVPQAVSVWGQSAMVQKPETSGSQLSVFEAYTKLKMSDYWHIQLGRQAISLDDERFYGALDWAQGARAFDGLQFDFKNDKLQWKNYFVYNQNYKTLYGNNINNPTGNLYNPQDAYPFKWMQTMWGSVKIDKHSNLSALVSNLGFQNELPATVKGTTNWLQTFGMHYTYQSQKISTTGSAYLQTGKNLNAVNTTAYLLAVSAGTFVTNHLSVSLGSDFLSGNKLGSTTNHNKAFNPFFGTNHKFYGSMDYFYAGSDHKNTGLSDSYIKLNWSPSKKTTCNFTVHQFFSPTKIVDANEKYASNLGQEADLGVNVQLNKMASLQGGYSFYITNPTINYLKNTPNGKSCQQWFWMSLNITPKFFETKY